MKLGAVLQSTVRLMSVLMTNWLTIVVRVFLNTLIFSCKNVKSYPHFFSKNINVFAIFQDRNVTVMLAYNFVKF